MKKYDFTYKTTDEYLKAKQVGYIENYNIVRISVSQDKYSIDYPIHSEEEFNDVINHLETNNINYNVYPDFHSYDVQDYV